MQLAATIVVAFVAVLHLFFLVLEMFLWRTRFGRRTFRTTPEQAETSAVLAANQGLYNGFLAAGLIWALIAYGAVAGIFGAATVSRRILIIQALPAAIGAALLWLA